MRRCEPDGGSAFAQRPLTYERARHAAARTGDYVFSQLIPYIGNKRKLLDLIQEAVAATRLPRGATFLDLFAGSGVVSRLAKVLGFRVIANDWEPYTRALNTCWIACNSAPAFHALGGYEAAIETLNGLPPRVDWVTEHLCPRNDDACDPATERLFFMRRNGMRIDAIRHQIAVWKQTGTLGDAEEACLIAPLLYQVCYTSNTSGVFKGFHNGWGGRTGTALYRIASNLTLTPCVFLDNAQDNLVLCRDAQAVAEQWADTEIDVAYLDPPYNQHPYGSNYHVLNSVALWDRPPLSHRITAGHKAAIRTDWRTQRRSPYNHRETAGQAYARLLSTLNARYILTSYSTDGTIPLAGLLRVSTERGHVTLSMRGYKRYRVSSQRFSHKPMNIEFLVLIDTHGRSQSSADELLDIILRAEQSVLDRHPESRPQDRAQGFLFEV